MYKVKYIQYKNDLERTDAIREFSSLDDVSDWLFGMVKGQYSKKLYFVDPEKDIYPDGILRLEKTDIAATDDIYAYWIQEISEDDKILYSCGTYTNGICHWCERIREWLKACRERVSNPSFDFEVDYRYITLSTGSTMGDEIVILKTNAPQNLLKQLEKESNQAILDEKDPPIWVKQISEVGFDAEYVDSHRHVTAHGLSSEWLAEHPQYSKITEHYRIENQPELEMREMFFIPDNEDELIVGFYNEAGYTNGEFSFRWNERGVFLHSYMDSWNVLAGMTDLIFRLGYLCCSKSDLTRDELISELKELGFKELKK